MPHADPEAKRAWRRAWWAALPLDRKREKNAAANRRATALRRWLDAYKLTAGCVDCGYRKHHAALHFDHVAGDKALNVCEAKSLHQAKQEIAKCVVRCANCHAEKTFTHYAVEVPPCDSPLTPEPSC